MKNSLKSLLKQRVDTKQINLVMKKSPSPQKEMRFSLKKVAPALAEVKDGEV